jgi:hypothetical protein
MFLFIVLLSHGFKVGLEHLSYYKYLSRSDGEMIVFSPNRASNDTTGRTLFA